MFVVMRLSGIGRLKKRRNCVNSTMPSEDHISWFGWMTALPKRKPQLHFHRAVGMTEEAFKRYLNGDFDPTL